MLSIGKLGFGQEGYYLNTVATGVEDYYVGRGEAPGRWIGALGAELGLDSQVDADTLRQVLAGRDPSTGAALSRARARRVPGFDLTFCAPKSVSVLWGLAEPETSREVRAAHEVSVDAALAYLERQACWSRRGTNGVVALRGDGFIGAGFRHRTSRAGDPHLHTHVLVANGTRSGDGRWGALDARHLYLHAKTAGHLYRAQLRAELTERLGVTWSPVVNGLADIDGIPAEVLRRFSTRRREIEAELATRGVTSPRAAQYATLDTRDTKSTPVEPTALRTRWAEQAATIGWDHEQLDDVTGQACPATLSAAQIDEITDRLLGPDGLTRHASTFDRRAAIQAWCDHRPDGADITLIEQLADQTLADPRVVPLAPDEQARVGTMRHHTTGRQFDTPSTGTRYSTHELLALETRLVDRAVQHTETGPSIASEEHLLAALAARPSLSDEQVELVATLTTSGRPVDVVIAAAGTGKTFSLDAARDAWQRSGHHVIGAALAARAAAELEATAGIPSRTIASLLIDLDDAEHGHLPPRTVLIVDEAGMVGTRQLARILDHAHAARAKVVLVGDPRQLPEIDAGGLLRGLARRIPPLRLAQNRRQHEPWERHALAQLRGGKIDQAIASYNQHGRIHTHDTAPAARDAMCADWWAATLAGNHTLMLATRWSDVDDLNARARTRLHEAGRLTGPTLTIDDRPYQAGDRIITLRNDRRLHVRNGTSGQITAIDTEQRAMTVRTDAGPTVTLPAPYLDAGHVRHAYATTIHKAQGQTVDRAFLLGSDLLYQEAGYVALSRGRTENRIYLVGHEPREEAHTPEPAPPTPLDTLTQSLGVSHAQHLALEHGIDRNAIRREVRLLTQEQGRLREIERQCPPSNDREIEALTETRDAITDDLLRSRHQLDAVDRERGWRGRHDRHVRAVVLTDRIHKFERRADDVADALDHAQQEQQPRLDYLQQHHEELERLPTVEQAIETRITQLVDADLARAPNYLRMLGPPPTEHAQREYWRRAATYVERRRSSLDITDPDHPFGPEPDRGATLWRHDMRYLAGLVERAQTPAHEIEADLGLGV